VGNDVNECICWISNEEGSPGTSSGPTTVCSDYEDDCAWDYLGSGHVAGVEYPAIMSWGQAPTSNYTCWAYLPDPNFFTGSAVLDLVKEQTCQLNGVNGVSLTYNKDDLGPYTLLECRDECIMRMRYYDLEDNLAGLQLDSPFTDCKCILSSIPTVTLPGTSASYDASALDNSAPGTGRVTGGDGTDGANEPSDKNCYGWVLRDYNLRNSRYISYNTLQYIGYGYCQGSSDYKYIGYSMTDAANEYKIDQCRDTCITNFETYGIIENLVGFSVETKSATTKDCICFSSTDPYFSLPSIECSYYGATGSCDLSPTGTGLVQDVDASKDSINGNGDHSTFCYAWQTLDTYTRRRGLEEVAGSMDDYTRSREFLTSPTPKRNLRSSSRRSLQLSPPVGGSPTTVRGEGIATVNFGTRRRVYRRSLKTGEDGWVYKDHHFDEQVPIYVKHSSSGGSSSTNRNRTDDGRQLQAGLGDVAVDDRFNVDFYVQVLPPGSTLYDLSSDAAPTMRQQPIVTIVSTFFMSAVASLYLLL
jgi:hypothetical protein